MLSRILMWVGLSVYMCVCLCVCMFVSVSVCDLRGSSTYKHAESHPNVSWVICLSVCLYVCIICILLLVVLKIWITHDTTPRLLSYWRNSTTTSSPRSLTTVQRHSLLPTRKKGVYWKLTTRLVLGHINALQMMSSPLRYLLSLGAINWDGGGE